MARISKRLLSKRSPPRIVTIEGGIGSRSANPKKVSSRINEDFISDEKKIPTPVLLNIQRLPEESSTTLPLSVVTTVEKQPNQKSMHRLEVPRRESQSIYNVLSGLTSIGTAENSRPQRLQNTGNLSETRTNRKRMSSNILGSGIRLNAGEMQVWGIPSGISEFNVNGAYPVLKIDGDQMVRITFHRGAGGIIQDIEIPPDSLPTEIEVPLGTKRFTLTGWGGQSLIPEGISPGPAAVTSLCSTLNKTTLGFQRNSVINQVGPYRYLCRGGFIESDSAPTNSAMSKRTNFSAREVLSKLDRIKFYTTRAIRTVVVVTKTRSGGKPSLNLEMTGVQAISNSTRVDRKDSSVHVWPVAVDQNYEGPSIIEVLTDEDTDVHSIMANISGEQSVVEMLTSSTWTDLIEEGPLSPYGSNHITWVDDIERTNIPKENIIIRSNRQDATEPKIQEIVEVASKPISEPSETDLPIIQIPDGIAHESYSFDISTFADDEDEEDKSKLNFTLIKSPQWLNLTPKGIIQGEATNDDSGLIECIIRVTDPGGLHSDAMIRFNIEPKQLNRAPFWKPNIKSSENSNSVQKKDEKVNNEESSKSSRRRRR